MHLLHFALLVPKCVCVCVFDAVQDLRPLYAGRCDYHSSEAERDVRHASFNSLSSSASSVSSARAPCQRAVRIPPVRSPVRRRHAPPAICGWRATPATAANSTTAASECGGRLNGAWLSLSVLLSTLPVSVWTTVLFLWEISLLLSFVLFLLCNCTDCDTTGIFIFGLTFVSENILLLDFRIKMFWKSLGNHPWFGSRSLFF